MKAEPIVEAKITEGFWNDFGGSEISRISLELCVLDSWNGKLVLIYLKNIKINFIISQN